MHFKWGFFHHLDLFRSKISRFFLIKPHLIQEITSFLTNSWICRLKRVSPFFIQMFQLFRHFSHTFSFSVNFRLQQLHFSNVFVQTIVLIIRVLLYTTVVLLLPRWVPIAISRKPLRLRWMRSLRMNGLLRVGFFQLLPNLAFFLRFLSFSRRITPLSILNKRSLMWQTQ